MKTNETSIKKLSRGLIALPIGPKISFYLENNKLILERNDEILRKYSSIHNVKYEVEDIILSNGIKEAMETILRFNSGLIDKISFIYEPQEGILYTNEIILNSDTEDGYSYVLLDPDASAFLVNKLQEKFKNFTSLEDLRIKQSKEVDIEEPNYPYGLVNNTPIIRTLTINPMSWEHLEFNL